MGRDQDQYKGFSVMSAKSQQFAVMHCTHYKLERNLRPKQMHGHSENTLFLADSMFFSLSILKCLQSRRGGEKTHTRLQNHK